MNNNYKGMKMATKVAKHISEAKSRALDCNQKYIILPPSEKKEFEIAYLLLFI